MFARIAPALAWYTPQERIEMSASTLRRWLSKVASLVTEEASAQPPGGAPTVHLALPTHWRTLVWACGTWLAGGTVVLGGGAEAARALEADPTIPAPQVSVACEPQQLLAQAPAQVLTPLASLALRWPGELPALTIDGAADLMAYPDAFSPPPASPKDLALVVTGPQPQRWTRGELAGLIAPTQVTPRQGLLVHEPSVAQALTGCLRAWAADRQAVLLAWPSPEELVESAARQERALRG